MSGLCNDQDTANNDDKRVAVDGGGGVLEIGKVIKIYLGSSKGGRPVSP